MHKKFTIVLDEDLYEAAKQKCKMRFGIGLTPLVKIFLKAFTTQKGIGFYIGDEGLADLFDRYRTGRMCSSPWSSPQRFV